MSEAVEVEEEDIDPDKPRLEFFRLRRIGRPGDVYLWRLCIFTCPWFSVKLHRIMRADETRDLHDHPWTFLSIVLFGWYREELTCRPGERMRPRRKVGGWRRFNFKRAEDLHTITYVSRRPVWTLVFTGPRRRNWGFLTPDGWVDAREYDREA